MKDEGQSQERAELMMCWREERKQKEVATGTTTWYRYQVRYQVGSDAKHVRLRKRAKTIHGSKKSRYN